MNIPKSTIKPFGPVALPSWSVLIISLLEFNINDTIDTFCDNLNLSLLDHLYLFDAPHILSGAFEQISKNAGAKSSSCSIISETDEHVAFFLEYDLPGIGRFGRSITIYQTPEIPPYVEY